MHCCGGRWPSSLYSASYEQPDVAVALNYPFKCLENLVYFVGSCNGLVCIYYGEIGGFVWNPSTRNSKRLPQGSRDYPVNYGFCYDESVDDYKIVGVVSGRGREVLHKTEVKVYSLRTESWRRIGDFPHGCRLFDSGKFLNGAFHWIGYIDRMFPFIVVSVDLGTGRYGEVLEPDYRDGPFDVELGVLSGCLCIFCAYDKICADVWVMKEYGIRESWTKLVVIPYINDPLFTPSCLSKNGEVLLSIGRFLVPYYPKDGSFGCSMIHYLPAYTSVYMVSYIESLVSPGVGNDKFFSALIANLSDAITLD